MDVEEVLDWVSDVFAVRGRVLGIDRVLAEVLPDLIAGFYRHARIEFTLFELFDDGSHLTNAFRQDSEQNQADDTRADKNDKNAQCGHLENITVTDHCGGRVVLLAGQDNVDIALGLRADPGRRSGERFLVSGLARIVT
jgi:hypothetical protein